MCLFKKVFMSMCLLLGVLSAFEIDAFDPKAPMLENFSTNCLQMTQSQQILKAYIMIGLHSNFGNPKEELAKAIPLYDKRAYQVREYFQKRLDGHEDAKKAFDEAMVLWNTNKEMLLQSPTKENAVKIKKNFLLMINKLLAGTQPLATPELELISLTGKLCRKPLEITIDYLLRIWEVDIENYDEEINKIIANYGKNLKILSEDKLNNSESQKLLDKAKKQFMYFEFAHKSGKVSIPSLLSKKADNNFMIIREIKKVFKKQAARK
jgi:hypothetical protein